MADAAVTRLRELLLAEAAVQARRLARIMRLGADHVADLEQEILLDLIKRLPAYDSKRGRPSTFVSLVAANKARRLLMRHHVERLRWGESVLSLDELDADALDARTCREDFGWDGIDPVDAFELRHDVAAVFDALPADLRDLCTSLASCSVSQIARVFGCSRAAVYRDIARLRTAFVAAGFQINPRGCTDTSQTARVHSRKREPRPARGKSRSISGGKH